MAEITPKLRLVLCPKCENILPELADYSLYQCGGCGTVLGGKLISHSLLFQTNFSCFLTKMFVLLTNPFLLVMLVIVIKEWNMSITFLLVTRKFISQNL